MQNQWIFSHQSYGQSSGSQQTNIHQPIAQPHPLLPSHQIASSPSDISQVQQPSESKLGKPIERFLTILKALIIGTQFQWFVFSSVRMKIAYMLAVMHCMLCCPVCGDTPTFKTFACSAAHAKTFPNNINHETRMEKL